MAKLLTFTNDQFAHLSGEAKLDAKRIVYRKDFQEDVLRLRQKYRIQDFPKINPQKLLQTDQFPNKEQHIEDNWHRYRLIPRSDHDVIPDFFAYCDYDPLAGFADEVRTISERHGTDALLWLQLLHVYTRFNVIPTIVMEGEAVAFPPPPEAIKHWKKVLKQYDSELKEGKVDLKDIFRGDHVFYFSNSISAKEDGFGIINLRFNIDAPPKTLRKVLKQSSHTRKRSRHVSSGSAIFCSSTCTTTSRSGIGRDSTRAKSNRHSKTSTAATISRRSGSSFCVRRRSWDFEMTQNPA